jgi:hypothetical protein
MAGVSVFGFGLLRNGVKYDYCFEESLNSLTGVCEEVVLALGQSDDGTEERVAALEKIYAVPTIWDDALRAGGLILSQQTNIALDALRDRHGEKSGAWGIYLQCDELLHEDDYELIKTDLALAEAGGYEAMTFRYLHFWQSHHLVAINKKWYPQEIRAVKLKSNAESWGDAQGFRNVEKIYHSEARVFHYGHVREPSKYIAKKTDILKLYHADEKLPKYKKRERRYDSMTEVLPYWGTQPQRIRARMERLGERWQLPFKESVFIVADPADFSTSFRKAIRAKRVHWVSDIYDVPREQHREMVLMKDGFFSRIFWPSFVPNKMRSKLARVWSNEFRLTLKLSEKCVGVSSRNQD